MHAKLEIKSKSWENLLLQLWQWLCEQSGILCTFSFWWHQTTIYLKVAKVLRSNDPIKITCWYWQRFDLRASGEEASVPLHIARYEAIPQISIEANENFMAITITCISVYHSPAICLRTNDGSTSNLQSLFTQHDPTRKCHWRFLLWNLHKNDFQVFEFKFCFIIFVLSSRFGFGDLKYTIWQKFVGLCNIHVANSRIFTPYCVIRGWEAMFVH